MNDCGGWMMFFLVGGAFIALATFALMVLAIVRSHYRDNGSGGHAC